ncbi:MAG: DUF4173 domain-containing protein [Anaerolineales bacterium]|nr:DUF4173 domain-containing protein [Anaerolineales bacterium]
MKANPNRLWISMFALGWIFDLLFWKKIPGINFAIFITLCLLTGFVLLWWAGLRPGRASTGLLLPIFFLLVMSFMRREPMTLFLTCGMALFLVGALAITYLGGRWIQYGVADYIAGFFGLLISTLSLGIVFTSETRREQAEAGSPVNRVRWFWPVVRGVLIAVPLVAFFAWLLSEADQIYALRVEEFIQLFRLEKIPEYIFRLSYILVLGYILAGVLLHAAWKSSQEKLVGEEKPAVPAFLGFVETVIVLVSIVVLFASFVIVQFQYFFGGTANINFEGFTFSEYARRGFGELVAVAFFSLLLLLGLSGISRRKGPVQRRSFSALGIGLVGLVIVMLVSAYHRLVLYETAYGFSRLRTYTHVFMIWLGVLLVAVILLEILRRQRAFAFAAVMTSLGFIISLSVLNVDAFIVRQNVARGLQGEEFDWQYLVTLSDDAVPVLARAYSDQRVSKADQTAIGAVLVCFDNYPEEDTPAPWQSFHLSRWRAERVLESMQPDLDDYSLNTERWPLIVIGPNLEEYPCYSDWYMD